MTCRLVSAVPVRAVCRYLGLQSSWVYRRLKEPIEPRARFELGAQIEATFNASHQTYGSPRVQTVLKNKGICCSRRTVSRIMRERDLVARPRKPWTRTTHTEASHKPAQRLFKTEDKSTAPQGPNEVWVGDVTYIWVKDRFYYLAVVLDVFHRAVVGWSLTDGLEVQGVISALEGAFQRARPRSGLVFHSDRGSQYTSAAFKKTVAHYGGILSMSRKGNCYDNAFAESFFKTLKTEVIYKKPYLTCNELRHALFVYIEGWYNPHRIHTSLNNQSPEQFLHNQLKKHPQNTPEKHPLNKNHHPPLDTT